MANIYFGDGLSAVDGNWNNSSNWYLTPANRTCVPCSCPTYSAGTPAGRVPTSADTVILLAIVTTGPTGGWAFPLQITSAQPFTTAGGITSGSYSGNITLAGGHGIDGGTFTGSTLSQGGGTITGGTFSNAVTTTGGSISGGTFTNTGSTSLTGSNISGGTFSGPIVGNSLNIHGTPTFSSITSLAGNNTLNFSTSLALPISMAAGNTLTISGGTYGGNISITRTGSGSSALTITISGGTFNGTWSFSGPGTQTGTLAVNISAGTFNNTIQTGISKLLFAISGGTYAPPAVQTPAIKSGNFMTFAASAIPADPGFKANGGTYTPTIDLTGTSNDILGAGLL